MLYLQTLTQEMGTGYGGAANAFIMELHRRKYPMVFGNLFRRYLFNTDMQSENLPKELKPDIQIYFGQPYKCYENQFFERVDINGNKRSLKLAPIWGCLTMFEANELPEFWVDDINNKYKFDFLIVPSEWCKRVFEKAGIKCPIYYVPLGVDPAMYPLMDRPAKDRFVFLHRRFYIGDRKGGELVSDAFKNLKDRGELKDAMLILKSTPLISRFKGDVDLGPTNYNIYYMQNLLGHAEMLQMIQYADFGLHPTSGEGFGLMPLEEMATGLPVAISNNTGCTEYVDPLGRVNFPINCLEGLKQFGKILTEMQPDPAHVEEIMLHAYNNRDEIRAMGARAADYVRRAWTYQQAVSRFLEVIHGIQ